jgi:hypothetical protein
MLLAALAAALVAAPYTPSVAPAGAAVRANRSAHLEQSVSAVVRADYRGEVATLDSLAGTAFESTLDDPDLGTLALYWRGFAHWRKAFNVMNDDVRSPVARAELRRALADFTGVVRRDPACADAQAGRASCLMLLGYLAFDPDSMRAAVRAYVPILDEAARDDPDNPRVLWLLATRLYYSPPEAGGGADPAIAVLQRGLVAADRARRRPRLPLAPAWGEPELLASLAWMWSNRPDPDFARAEAFAAEALRLVPDWKYLRDVQLPNIRRARDAAGH